MPPKFVFQGADLSDATDLPVIETTPEGAAFGAGRRFWDVFFDPAYMVAGALRNRAQPGAPLAQNIDGVQTLGEFPNEAPALSFSGTSRVLPNVAVNPNAWTFLTLLLTDTVSGVTPDLARSITDATDPGISLRVGLNNSRTAALVLGAASDRLRYTPETAFPARSTPTLLVYSFSTRDGLRIFDNGALADSAPDDKRPLTSGFGAGEWRMFGGFRDLVGMTGVLNIDLSWPEHTAYRRQIEAFMATKYGITLAV